MKKIVKVLAINKNKTLLKTNDNEWYHIPNDLVKFIDDIKINDEVEITYNQDKYNKILTYINKIKNINNTEFRSESKDVRRIMKGNCLNASAMALSGTETDPDILAEKILRLANKLLIWLEINE